MLLALDPSINSAGIALFRDGVLVDAATIKAPKANTRWPYVRRCAWVAREVWKLVPVAEIKTFATEWPQTYAPGMSKARPSDLHPMAGVATAVAARFFDAELFSYLPKQWVVGTAKEAGRGIFKTSRALRIASKLSPVELAVWAEKVNTHDAIDAVGIGLHQLGRLAPKRAISRE